MLASQSGMDNLLDVLVVVIPLSVEIICHVDDVVDNLGHILDGELLQIPVRSGRGDGKTLVPWQTSADSLQKFKIVRRLVCAAWRNARDIWCTRILPVKIHTIQAVVVDKVDHLLRKAFTIGRQDDLPEDEVRGGLRRKPPAAKGQDP